MGLPSGTRHKVYQVQYTVSSKDISLFSWSCSVWIISYKKLGEIGNLPVQSKIEWGELLPSYVCLFFMAGWPRMTSVAGESRRRFFGFEKTLTMAVCLCESGQVETWKIGIYDQKNKLKTSKTIVFSVFFCLTFDSWLDSSSETKLWNLTSREAVTERSQWISWSQVWSTMRDYGKNSSATTTCFFVFGNKVKKWVSGASNLIQITLDVHQRCCINCWVNEEIPVICSSLSEIANVNPVASWGCQRMSCLLKVWASARPIGTSEGMQFVVYVSRITQSDMFRSNSQSLWRIDVGKPGRQDLAEREIEAEKPTVGGQEEQQNVKQIPWALIL